MKIYAAVSSSEKRHTVEVATNETVKTLQIKPKVDGKGSSINGGELLFLSLATCYCNDVYREAESKRITVHTLDIMVHGEFADRGEPATNVCFDVRVSADAREDEVEALLRLTDRVAEIQNTMRIPVPVILRNIEIL